MSSYILSLAASSTLLNPLVDHPSSNRSCSPIASLGSSRTVQHRRLRSISTSSLSSVGSWAIPSRPFRRHASSPGPTPPAPHSSSSMSLGYSGRLRAPIERSGTEATATGSRRTSSASAFSGRIRLDSVPGSEQTEARLGDVIEGDDELIPSPIQTCQVPVELSAGSESEEELNDIAEHELEDDFDPHFHREGQATPMVDIAGPASESQHQQPPAFSRWVSKLRRKRHNHPQLLSPRKERWTLDDFDTRAASPGQQYLSPGRHYHSDSQGSSVRFVTAVRSATATLASASMATLSRRTTRFRRGHQRSSIVSGSEIRLSIESRRSIIDEAAKQRARKRREKLEELIRTEESYVADVKALSNVRILSLSLITKADNAGCSQAYFTILAHQPTATSFARTSTQRTIADILHLHDDILGCLHRIVPFAEYDQTIARLPLPLRAHNRWHSMDAVPQRTTPNRSTLATIRQGRRSLNISRSSSDDAQVVLRCSPQTIAAVAKAFSDNVG